MNSFRSVRFALAVLGASVLLPTAGMASTCSTSDVTTSTACLVFSGNNSNQSNLFNPGPMFGISNWFNVEDGVDTNGTVGVLTMSGKGDTSGTWSVSSFGGNADAILVVKGGDSFAAYLLNTADLSGTWSTDGIPNGGGKIPDVSHLALYEGGPLTATPLPAAFPLFAAGLSAMGLLVWRRTRKNAAALAAA
jgi:hypothetical protein